MLISLACSAAPAAAQNCDFAAAIAEGRFILGRGGSAQDPTVRRFAQAFQTFNPPVIVAYDSSAGACSAMASLVGTTQTHTGSVRTWNAAGVESTCTIPVATPVQVDFGIMGNGPELCPGITQADLTTNNIIDVTGAVGSVNLIVNPTLFTNGTRSISAEAVYYVFKHGQDARIAPWTVNANITRRNQNSYVQQYLALAVGATSADFSIGVDAMTNGNTIARVANAATAGSAIGFTSGEQADANRATVATLAYQHYGQSCGYWPDSTPTARDKRNVRNGQYWLFGPAHFYARGTAAGAYVNPLVKTFFDWVRQEIDRPANAPAGTKLGLDIVIENGNIPECAMTVRHVGDLGPLQSFAPPRSCATYFEFKATGSAPAGAVPCTAPSECPAGRPACNYGYCEVR